MASAVAVFLAVAAEAFPAVAHLEVGNETAGSFGHHSAVKVIFPGLSELAEIHGENPVVPAWGDVAYPERVSPFLVFPSLSWPWLGFPRPDS